MKPSEPEIEALVQNYLYFGLLHETFGEFVDISDFITENSSRESIITTTPLEERLTKWAEQVKQQRDPDSTDEADW